MFPLYMRVWEQQLLKRWRPAKIVHGLLWGGMRRVLEKAKQEGSITLGQVVNAHRLVQKHLLEVDADRVGIKLTCSRARLSEAILAEVHVSNHLLALSKFARASFISEGYPADRIHIVRPRQDLTRFFPADEKEKAKFPYNISRFMRWPNWHSKRSGSSSGGLAQHLGFRGPSWY